MKAIKLLEDEAHTDGHVNELHDFLNAPTYSQGHEWEGHGSGIYINLSVAQGDTILVNDDQSIRVLRKGEDVLITWETFPAVHACLVAIEHDNGAHHVNRIVGEGTVDLHTFKMPYDYGVDKLARAETAITKFRWHCEEKIQCGIERVFNELIVGEQGRQEEILASFRPTIPDLVIAHRLLNDWFNAWEDGDKVQYYFKDEKPPVDTAALSVDFTDKE